MPSDSDFIPYGRQQITDDDVQSVVETLKSNYLTQGPAVPAFENAVALRVCASHAVAVNSATSALHVACLGLGLTAGDWLWTSPTTFVASANCARYCGANVDFVDINPLTGLISISALISKLKEARRLNKLPKILVPVHLAGSSCDMSAIKELSIEYGFFVLEDASHAIGGTYFGQPVGSCTYSHACVFSFHPVKIITTCEGGIVTTNDNQLAFRMSKYRCHGITKEPSEFLYSDALPWAYEQQSLGYNYRLSDLHASLGLSQLKRLDDIILERQNIFRHYSALLKTLPVELLQIPPNVISSLHLAIIRLSCVDQDIHLNLFNHLRASNIGVQLHYIPVHLQPYYRQLGFKFGDFPAAENHSLSTLSLPIYPGLTQSEVVRVVREITNFFAKS